MSNPNAELETPAGFIARSRKAGIAWLGSALTAAAPQLIAAAGDGLTGAEISSIAVSSLVAGFAVAVGVWWIPNKGA